MISVRMSQFMSPLAVPFSQFWGVAHQVDGFPKWDMGLDAEIYRNFLFSINHCLNILHDMFKIRIYGAKLALSDGIVTTFNELIERIMAYYW